MKTFANFLCWEIHLKQGWNFWWKNLENSKVCIFKDMLLFKNQLFQMLERVYLPYRELRKGELLPIFRVSEKIQGKTISHLNILAKIISLNMLIDCSGCQKRRQNHLITPLHFMIKFRFYTTFFIQIKLTEFVFWTRGPKFNKFYTCLQRVF